MGWHHRPWRRRMVPQTSARVGKTRDTQVALNAGWLPLHPSNWAERRQVLGKSVQQEVAGDAGSGREHRGAADPNPCRDSRVLGQRFEVYLEGVRAIVRDGELR